MADPYALMISGGKQHRVKVGQKVKLEKLEVEAGESCTFDQVLMVANGDQVQLGRPLLEGAKVHAEVVRHFRGDKITVIKFRRRQNSRKKQGHRQFFTEVQVTAIES